MNYESTLKNTYNIDVDVFTNTGAIALMESGGQVLIGENDITEFTYDGFLSQAVNYASRESDLQDTPVMILAKAPDNLVLACSTKVDFVSMYISFGDVLSAYSKSQNGTYYDIGDGVNLYNYPQYNYNNESFGTFTYGQYHVYCDGDYAIYDFSSVQNATLTNFRQDSFYLRGENIAYYNSYLSLYNLTSNSTLTISYGSPIYENGNVEYERGFNNGYQGGFVNGYDGGYNDGLTMGGIDGNTANAFTYIGGAFQVVNNIMALEVLPHVTIGLCFSIPMVLVMIMVIFRLVKK